MAPKGHPRVHSLGGLTDFEATLTVRDTQSGASKTDTKEGGSFCGGADTGAF